MATSLSIMPSVLGDSKQQSLKSTKSLGEACIKPCTNILCSCVENVSLNEMKTASKTFILRDSLSSSFDCSSTLSVSESTATSQSEEDYGGACSSVEEKTTSQQNKQAIKFEGEDYEKPNTFDSNVSSEDAEEEMVSVRLLLNSLEKQQQLASLVAKKSERFLQLPSTSQETSEAEPKPSSPAEAEVEHNLMEDWEDLEVVLQRMHTGDLDGEEFDMLSEMGILPSASAVLPFPTGKQYHGECGVCLGEVKVQERACCQLPVCDECMAQYCNGQVEQGQVRLRCPASRCDAWLPRDEILHRLTAEHKERFYRFLVNNNVQPHVKTCPRCCLVSQIDPSLLHGSGKSSGGIRFECSECHLQWCFRCQAPLHPGISCKKYSKGDQLVKRWAKAPGRSNRNAQRCPKCKVYIERISGCDHMVCDRCHTEFCYQCGEKFRSFQLVGNHYSALSILGCSKRFLSNSPHLRRFIRGSIFVAKLLAIPPGACLLLVAAVFAAPVYGSVRLHRYLRERRMRSERKRRNRERLQVMRELRARAESLEISRPLHLVPREAFIQPQLCLDRVEPSTAEEASEAGSTFSTPEDVSEEKCTQKSSSKQKEQINVQTEITRL